MTNFLFCFGEYPGEHPNKLILINPKSYWNRYHCISSYFNEQEREDIHQIFSNISINMCELTESYYEWPDEKTKEEIKAELETIGIEFSQEMQEFINKIG